MSGAADYPGDRSFMSLVASWLDSKGLKRLQRMSFFTSCLSFSSASDFVRPTHGLLCSKSQVYVSANTHMS